MLTSMLFCYEFVLDVLLYGFTAALCRIPIPAASWYMTHDPIPRPQNDLPSGIFLITPDGQIAIWGIASAQYPFRRVLEAPTPEAGQHIAHRTQVTFQ